MDTWKPLVRLCKPVIGRSPEQQKHLNEQNARHKKFATERAILLFRQFRKGEANDPDTYVMSVAAVLSDFPEEIILHATDPRTGLASHSTQWLPTLFEVRQFCNDLLTPSLAQAARDAQISAQFAERDRIDAVLWGPLAKERRATLDELRAKYGRDWGIDQSSSGPIDKPRGAAVCRPLSEIARECGVSDEQIAAMPESFM